MLDYEKTARELRYGIESHTHIDLPELDNYILSLLQSVAEEVRQETFKEAGAQLKGSVHHNKDKWRETPSFEAHYLAEVKWGTACDHYIPPLKTEQTGEAKDAKTN